MNPTDFAIGDRVVWCRSTSEYPAATVAKVGRMGKVSIDVDGGKRVSVGYPSLRKVTDDELDQIIFLCNAYAVAKDAADSARRRISDAWHATKGGAP